MELEDRVLDAREDLPASNRLHSDIFLVVLACAVAFPVSLVRIVGDEPVDPDQIRVGPDPSTATSVVSVVL